MQQKAQLIAALLHEPDLIVVDEPFSGLDPVNTRLDQGHHQGAGGRRPHGHHVHPPDVPGGGALRPHRAHRPWAERALWQVEQDQAGVRRQRRAGRGRPGTSPACRRCSRPARRTATWRLSLDAGADPQEVLRALLGRPGVKVERFELAEPSLDDIFISVVTGGKRRLEGRRRTACRKCASSPAGSTSATCAGAASSTSPSDCRCSFSLMMALSVVSGETAQGDPASVGYVDQSGVLGGAVENPGSGRSRYWTRPAAALEAREIRGYYVVSRRLRGLRPGRAPLLGPPTQRGSPGPLRLVPRSNLVAGARARRGRPRCSTVPTTSWCAPPTAAGHARPGACRPRPPLRSRPVLLVRADERVELPAAGRRRREGEPHHRDRATSVSPKQLIAGKAAGLMGVALTQMVLWALVVVGGWRWRPIWVDALAAIEISWGLVGRSRRLLRASVRPCRDPHDHRRRGRERHPPGPAHRGRFQLPLPAAAVLQPSARQQPRLAVMVVLTLFPTTSMLAIAVRWSATLVPLWQLITSWLILAWLRGRRSVDGAARLPPGHAALRP